MFHGNTCILAVKDNNNARAASSKCWKWSYSRCYSLLKVTDLLSRRPCRQRFVFRHLHRFKASHSSFCGQLHHPWSFLWLTHAPRHDTSWCKGSNDLFTQSLNSRSILICSTNSSVDCARWGKLKLPTDPRSMDYPTDYSADYPTNYSHGLPLIINQIPFYGVEKYKKHTCSTWNSRHFLYGRSQKGTVL